MSTPILDSPDLIVDFEHDSAVLVVAFGGLRGMTGSMAPFEFRQIISRSSVRAMFIRDPKALWYHGGCDGLGSTVEDLAKSLTELVRLSESERVIFMGASAGGYAAILFSCLVPAHRVLAFAPQTFLEPEQRAAVGDARWPEMTKRASSWLDRRYTDLRPIVEASAGLEIAVHYSARNRLDVIHAEHLGGVRPIDFVCHPEEAHSLPKILKDQGRLEAIIEKSILA